MCIYIYIPICVFIYIHAYVNNERHELLFHACSPKHVNQWHSPPAQKKTYMMKSLHLNIYMQVNGPPPGASIQSNSGVSPCTLPSTTAGGEATCIDAATADGESLKFSLRLLAGLGLGLPQSDSNSLRWPLCVASHHNFTNGLHADLFVTPRNLHQLQFI